MNNYFIIGDNKEVVDFNVFNILKDIKYDENNKIIYDLDDCSISDVLDEASMMGLFSLTKVIIGINFNDKCINDNEYDYLEKYINNFNKDVYLIFIAKKIDMRSKIFKLIKDKFRVIDTSKSNNKDDLFKYIKEYVNNKGYKIDSYNIEYLLDILDNDINNINLELDKIMLYLDNDKNIDRDVIDLLIIPNIDNVMYEFTNAVIDKDYDKVHKMYDNFKKENIGYDYILSSLVNCYHTLFIIKIMDSRNKSISEIASFINKKDFFVKKSLERLYRYSLSDIAYDIDKLFIIDSNFKSGKSNVSELELFLYGKR